MESVSEPICGLCGKLFGNVYIRNKHLKRIHNKKRENNMSQHLRCSLCPEEEKEALQSHEILIKHLTDVHGVTIKQFDLSFKNIAEFKTWRSKENREVDYVVARTNRKPNGNTYVYYNCNRSNPSGFKSSCTKRAEKANGSIKISGVCPSRIIVKILENGTVSGKFVETHVGHTDELRTKRLTKQEQAMIVDQLQAGVPMERILRDARKMKDIQVKRINLIRRGDLDYLMKKFNIDKKRCEDNMMVTALKIEEGDENVDEKLWRNIINKERRNANNYKHKMNVKAHREGEEMTDFVESVEFGKFRVKSTTGDAFYSITYNELCDNDCRMGYCHKCEVCFHRYICDCPEFCKKTTLCKHIHAVVLHERKNSESAPGIHGFGEEDSEEMLYIYDPTTSKVIKEEPGQFLEEKNIEPSTSIERRRQIQMEDMCCFVTSLDEESFEKYMDMYSAFKKNLEQVKNNEVCKKRKIEKQSNFPNKK